MLHSTKKTIAAGVALLLSFSTLVGCTQANNTPTATPTVAATDAPTQAPTDAPTKAPTDAPTTAPTDAATKAPDETKGTPLKFSMSYSDNATLPFKPDWLGVLEAQKAINAEITFEVIPNTDHLQKMTLSLNAGTAPDVCMYMSVRVGEVAALALNGIIYPIGDHEELTPNFMNMVEKYDLQEDVDSVKLKDGVRYYLPALYDSPFYDGGVIIRQDLLEEYGLDAPTTYDEYYEVLKKFKDESPESYPLTNLVSQRVTYRMSMPSFGISVGQDSSSGTNVLSYDYDKKEFFAGAIDDKYKEYLIYFNKLFEDGIYDPEFVNAGDSWTTKLATGAAMTSFAYYDQLGGIESTSEIDGIKFAMLPPMEGPGGAHHQPKSRFSAGVVFPTTTSKRADFEDIVKAVDKMFYSEELAEMWCLGVEGVTYTMESGKVKFNDEITSSADGVYKAMQLLYGLGTAPLQMVWINEREMTKYDENYSQLNKIVAEMDNAIQPLPPLAKFDDDQAEEASLLQAPLYDAFEIWANAFITGQKSIETDWDEYVSEMQTKGIDKFLKLYNDNK